MASTAWTANRADLVKALADAQARRQIAEAKLATYRANRHRVTQQAKDRARVREVAAAIQQLAAAQRQLETIQPDPNAKKHRADLLAALKEKP